ncbi:Thioesterase/thiol ester dehydrase-isomerase [Peniophora sp. CONT]|nr:Thioesterase/thiol ester dehydrase-isomerase [Peniophora sp. CONT]
MHDSYTEVLLPFASDGALFEQYTNASGGIRTGKLLEHLDSLAGSISYKHILGPNVETLGRIAERGFYCVTAAVDRLDMLAPLKPVRDLRLSGHVIHVGSSSMEVAVRMDALGKDGEEETLMLGRFAMVARDAFTHKAHPVNALVLKTPEEQALHQMGELNKQRRQSQARRSLRLVPPSSTEAEALHSFELQHARHDWSTRPHTQKRMWMEHTREGRTMLMFPQERNVHQKIFGGFLMRLAYELGFTTSRLFTRRPVTFLSLDKISFAKPVPIGSILRLKSEILYTEDNIVHVRVKAMVVEVETGAEQMTNDFRFTWAATEEAGAEQKSIPLVVPKTYREAMKWLEGRRALEISANIRRLRAAP